MQAVYTHKGPPLGQRSPDYHRSSFLSPSATRTTQARLSFPGHPRKGTAAGVRGGYQGTRTSWLIDRRYRLHRRPEVDG